jgi:hypothetical protein
MITKLFVSPFAISVIFIIGCAGAGSSKTAYRGTSIEEINAVSKINFESNKTNAYARIASRTDLSEAAQVHLVKAAFDNLSFDDSRSTVLLSLIENPFFCPAAEKAILKRLDGLSFEKTRDNILMAVNAVKALHSSETGDSEK